MADEARRKILEKVSALLAKAEASEFGEERDAFRRKADELMDRYAIETAELIQRQGRSLKDQVIHRRILVGDDKSWVTGYMTTMLRNLASHARCEHIGHPPYVSRYTPKEEQELPYYVTVVGMEADVDYVEMLFTSLRLQIANTLEPTYDHSVSLEDNVYTMRNAGIKWNRLEKLCGLPPNGPAMRAYARACEARGEVRRTRVNPKMVQRNFVDAFVNTIYDRLRALRLAREEQERQRYAEQGGTSALVPVKNAVKEVFNDLFPDIMYGKAQHKNGKFDAAAYGRGTAAGKRADLGQPKMAQRKSLEG